MQQIRKPRFVLSLAIAGALGCPAVTAAQQPPPKPAVAAKPKAGKPKSTTSGKTAAISPVGAQPALLGQYGDWGAYAAAKDGRKICYALATPGTSRTTPPNRPRNPAFIFVSSRPAENVRNEVSVIIGYSFKPGSDANVEIGPAKFAMYTQNDGAWLKNAAEEARMVEAMRKGADIVVTGTSVRGAQSTDRYSLKGLSQALDRAVGECK